jgi:hypothetical protein
VVFAYEMLSLPFGLLGGRSPSWIISMSRTTVLCICPGPRCSR